ncbi:hypothetical protein KCTC52924_01997 [Arenibacter antarcticus]|uniref:S41 family peptidase n=1 Tax=Arenibacter antarcticus TaxID=2040469 RepID=A0ABW5VC94_9FLAO|nr:S41 family peptidase [Arenibacter sp. H213]MCM4168425.1 hypothetical protein [Arenibacter sp. H213]
MQLIFKLTLVLGVLLPGIICAQNISKRQALEDVEQFKGILLNESSYLNSKGLNLEKELDFLYNSLDETVDIEGLYYSLMKIVGNIGDRHARVRWEGIKNSEIGLPFIMAPISGKIVALKKDLKNDKYLHFQKNHPFVKAINGLPIDQFMDSIAWSYKYAPKYSKTHYVTKERNYDKLLSKVFGKSDSYAFTFTNENGDKDKIINLKLENNPKLWTDITYKPNIDDAQSLFKIIGKNIGYISIPAMIDRNGKYGNLYRYVEAYMHDYKNTDALIIDLRNNGGGTRQFLMQLAPYFLSPEAKPWIANVAKIRSDQMISEDMESMQDRYLYNYNSQNLTDLDRNEIDLFMNDFKSAWEYDPKRFSDYFYMILRHDMGVNHYYYDKPVYILVNERSFSAASVFTTAVKGMGKVKIAGIRTDGSSGRSRKYDLKHTKINLKLSSMISLQRDGETLDANGTEPDIIIAKEMDQVLGNKDTQLETLIRLIEK